MEIDVTLVNQFIQIKEVCKYHIAVMILDYTRKDRGSEVLLQYTFCT